ncbi:TonB-dependent receptor plug domain-containing protein [Yunchengibacter salinarum]|uniref:TonB-dependent receptor plug domain-containing protein n=1 Tax=Yunchengibacter salinarum TaxID=3133399 RepID=UPI0035B643EC
MINRTAPVSALLFAAALPAGVAAEGPETIQITATRAPRLISEVASPVTVITGEDLEKARIFRVADALKGVAGLSIARAGGVGGQTQLRLRGGEANHTLILIDGVEMNDPAASDEVQLEHLTVAEIERIEVVRGPMSAAWGSEALSGVINIITKKGAGAPSLSASTEGGSFGTVRGQLGLGAGGTLGDGRRWHLRGGLTASDSTGTNVSRSGAENDGYDNLTANLRGGLDLWGAVTLDMSARHVDTRNEFDPVGADGLPVDGDRVSKTEKTYLSGRLTGRFLADRLTVNAKATFLDSALDNFADGAPNGSTGAEELNLALEGTLRINGRHTLHAGLEREETDFTQAGAASPFGDPNQRQSLNNTAFFADWSGRPLDGVSLNAGLRHDDNSAFEDVTTFRLGAAWRLAHSGTRFFANLSRGQKAPTFIERFGFFPDNFIGNPDLEPERNLSVEAGLEQSLWGDRLSLTVTGFSTRLKNEIDGFAFDPGSGLFTARNRDGKSKREGVEARLVARFSDTITGQANYAFVASRTPDGSREQRRPRHTAHGQLDWQVTPRLGLSLTGDYTGTALDTLFPAFPEPARTVALDDYLLVRIAGRYSITDRVRVTGRIENLLDERYEDVIGFQAPGLAAYAGLAVDF